MTVLQLNPFESHTTDYSQKLKTNILTSYFEMKRHNTLYSTISNTLPSKTEKLKLIITTLIQVHKEPDSFRNRYVQIAVEFKSILLLKSTHNIDYYLNMV